MLRLPVAILIAMLAGACSDEAPENGVLVTPVEAPAVAPPILKPVPAATTAPAAIARPLPPRRAFTDPPLPPELNDDGGLVPLPPGPTFAPSAPGTVESRKE